MLVHHFITILLHILGISKLEWNFEAGHLYYLMRRRWSFSIPTTTERKSRAFEKKPGLRKIYQTG